MRRPTRTPGPSAPPASSPRTTSPPACCARFSRAQASGSRVGRMPFRVVIGEDDVLLREGITRILEGAGLEVVAQTGNAEDFLRRAGAPPPPGPGGGFLNAPQKKEDRARGGGPP